MTEFASSVGYAMCTRAVISNIITFEEEGDPSKASFCSMEQFYISAGTRQPFRDALFAINGLFTQKMMEGIFWSGISLVRTIFCCDISKSWSLAQNSLIMALSNLACLVIAFVGMCRPRWGVSLWFYMTKEIVNSSGDEIVRNLTGGLTTGFERLQPALIYYLGEENRTTIEKAEKSLKEEFESFSKNIST